MGLSLYSVRSLLSFVFGCLSFESFSFFFFFSLSSLFHSLCFLSFSLTSSLSCVVFFMNLILSLIIPYFKSSYSVFHSSLSFFPSFLLFSPSPSLSFYFPVFSLSVHLSLTLYHFFLLEESFAKLRSLRKYLI